MSKKPRVPPGTEKMNKKALAAGVKLANTFDLDGLPKSITPDDEDVEV